MKIRACHKISWKKLISCLCFFYSYTWSYGQQQYGFTFYTREDGIASATITGIAKDSTGFLWLFSENGLTRFDGYDFKIFQNNPSDVLSISSPYISDMLIDSKKNIYFHAYNSISKYNPSHNTFTRLLSYFNNEYFLGWRSGKNCIWVMVKGSLIAITPDNPATYYALPAEFLIRNKPHMIESDNNFFIIGHNKIIRFDIEKKEFFDVPTFLLSGNNYEPENTSMRLFVDKEGTPGFCSSSGLFKYDKAGKKFLQKVAFYPNPATAGPFPSSVILRNNYSFAVLNNGTLQQVDLNVGSEKIISLSNHFDNEKGILIKAVYTGKGNNIWLTTNTPKFYSYHPETGLMEAFEAKGEKNTTRNNYFIFEDENGIVWISIAGSGLVKAEPVRKIFDLQRPSDSKIVYVSDNIRGISEWTKDSVLVNTINGVLLLNKSTSQFANFSYPEKSFSGSAYSKIIVDKDTNLWIAGWQRQGLFYVNRKTFTWNVTC